MENKLIKNSVTEQYLNSKSVEKIVEEISYDKIQKPNHGFKIKAFEEYIDSKKYDVDKNNTYDF